MVRLNGHYKLHLVCECENVNGNVGKIGVRFYTLVSNADVDLVG